MGPISDFFKGKSKPVQSPITPEVIHKFNNSEHARATVNKITGELRSKIDELENTIHEMLDYHDEVKDRNK